MDAVSLAARQRAHFFLLVAPLESEPTAIRARRDLALSEQELLFACGDFLPDVLVRVERGAALIDESDLHRSPPLELAAVGLLFADDHSKERRLARAVRADDADYARSR